MGKAGRPKGSKSENGRVAFQVRLSPDERKQVAAAAQIVGAPLSTWMRMTCLHAARALMED